ncbi:branched-subunit amino acid transport protein AzlD [Arthrobacter sp. 1088]|uniref:AzlD domain-containing protein n=1 Tax=Arthrobacter sp. 1088 TaxID=2817768 RepID=UPI00286403E7|nr:AzlD domain-containing protein [Arthrobacter sp. 1088]MDR6688629.1 branched-subunit amino acid transport protein AzlD [Arthrobacter sp. 1088]
MPDAGYILAVCAVVFVITLSLRAVPFAVLGRLQESAVVKVLAAWMPVGILGILMASTLQSSIHAEPAQTTAAFAAVAVTAATHLLGGRRTLLSVGIGTGAYVLLLQVLSG